MILARGYLPETRRTAHAPGGTHEPRHCRDYGSLDGSLDLAPELSFRTVSYR